MVRRTKRTSGAATAYACVKQGAAVHLVARNGQKPAVVRDWILRAAKEDPALGSVPAITCSAVDLDLPDAIARMVREAGEDLPLFWVQSLGLGGGRGPTGRRQPLLGHRGPER